MKTKFLYSTIVLVVTLGLFLGFNISEDIKGPKHRVGDKVPVVNNNNDNITPTPVVVTAGTVIYTDDLDGANDTTSLKARGYKPYYRGTGPQGANPTWFQGNPANWAAFNGPTSGYVWSNYASATDINNIDNWLVMPRIAGGLQAGDSLYFYARSFTANIYPDSMRVMYSANDSVPEGSWTECGRFLADISGSWVRKGFRAPTTSANGRFALRYCVVNGGPNGANSNGMGVDAITIERTAAPPINPTTWFELTSPATGTLASISAPTDNAVWAAGYTSSTSGPPFVVRTTNGGIFTSALGTGIGAGVPLFNIWGIDANTALATGSTSSSFIYKTTDGGLTWSTVLTQAGGFFNAIVMTDASNGFVTGDPVGGRWSLFRTTNGGTTWDSTGMFLPQAGSEAGWNNCAQKIGNNIWFGTNNTKVYYSSNNGANWVAQATGEAAASGSIVWFNDVNNGLYGGTTLRSTTNGGTVWNANAGIGTGVYSGITGNGNSFWTTRGTTAIGYSSNNGANWSTAYTSTGAVVNITKSRTGNLLYASKSTGGIVKYGVTVGVTPVTTVADNYSLSQNYPNPFNPSTSIKFALPTSGFTSLKIYNMLGKEVATLVSTNLSQGTYFYDFNASALSSGVYFYKLESGNFSEVKKMSLIK